MENAQLSDYEKYILVSTRSKYTSSTYTNFLKLKEVMSTLNQMVSKNNNTYTYYGEVYVSNLTAPEINNIQNCLDTGIWTSSFEKIKHICVDLGIVRF
jgi:predicted patatin/cPLA2 family phospholipase|tara:strand:+ start:123 stop:416 length:294 start_codon:yes stop_codon:yes gene_type:complete